MTFAASFTTRSLALLGVALALGASGHAVLLSTHIFSVAESLCDELAIIVDGRIVAQGSVLDLKEKTGTDSFENAFFKLYSEHHKE